MAESGKGGAKPDAPEDTVRVAINFPDDMPSAWATNLVVQHTKHEFFISFYGIAPPLIVGTDEQKRKQLATITEVKAQPIVKIMLAASRMPEFLQVMQDNYRTYMDAEREKETEPK